MTDSGNLICSSQGGKNQCWWSLSPNTCLSLFLEAPSESRWKNRSPEAWQVGKESSPRCPALGEWGDWDSRNTPNVTKAISKFLCRSQFPVPGFFQRGGFICVGLRVCVHVYFPPWDYDTYPAKRQNKGFVQWLDLCSVYPIAPGPFLSPLSLQFA